MSYPTLKAAFTECVKRLKAQGKPALGDADTTTEHNSCVYRNEQGLRCAVGIMLSDDTLDRIESAGLMNAGLYLLRLSDGVMDELSIDDLRNCWAETDDRTIAFWGDMQEAHDNCKTSDNWWDKVTPKFIAVAKEWDIDIKNTAVAS